MERIIEESVEIQQNEETNDSIDNVVLENSEWNDDDSFLVDIDHDEAMALTNESLLGSQVMYDCLARAGSLCELLWMTCSTK